MYFLSVRKFLTLLPGSEAIFSYVFKEADVLIYEKKGISQHKGAA